jgi:uncharacterized protein (TIGR03437 family)
VGSDAQGNVWLTGVSEQNLLPSQSFASNLPVPYVVEVSNDWTSFLTVLPTQLAGRSLASLPGGGIGVLGLNDSFLLSSPAPLLTITNSGTDTSCGTIAPTELLSLYGAGIGPVNPISGQVVNGAFTSSLGGYQVLFNGTPAPLLYAGPNQFNVVAPLSLIDQPTALIQILGSQGTTDFPLVYVAPARPQVFSSVSADAATFGQRYAVALNQDGTLNSAANPAPASSVVTIWVTGAYGTSAVLTPSDGQLAQPPPYAQPSVVVAVTAEGGDGMLDVQYASDAPGEVLGLTQINFRLPPDFSGSGPIVDVWVDEVRSDPVRIWSIK